MTDASARQGFSGLAGSGRTDVSRGSFREQVMSSSEAILLELDNDPVLHLLLTGQARTAAEAEEMYLNASLPEVLRLLQSSLSDEELGRHPLLVMYRRHGSRG